MPTRKPNPPAEQGWKWQAACRDHPDPELFHPKPPNPYSTRRERREHALRRAEQERRAKAVCAVCPVRPECYAEAIATDADGIWGGTTELERGKTPLR